MRRVSPWVLVPMLAVAAWATDDQYAFMPPGGRTLLSELVQGLDSPDVQAVLLLKADATKWADWARGRNPDLDEVSAQTVAGYAALNLPLAESAVADISDTDVTTILPPDGKDLSIAQCQFCHSLFSGYLMHDRDQIGWKSTFKAPFHKEIPMSQVERDTFASYSALNMPLGFEDVPPELRF